jgi:hypothetical protein
MEDWMDAVQHRAELAILNQHELLKEGVKELVKPLAFPSAWYVEWKPVRRK